MDAFIKQITKEAGELVGKKFGKVQIAKNKAHENDPVTATDIAANKFIVKAIKQKYPGHSIISEEAEADLKDSEYCWIIDPIDGTLNFAAGVPLFGTMIGLAKNGEMYMAAMYFPCTKELIFAKKGSGAFLNGKRTHCSEQKKFEISYGTVDIFVAKNALLAGKLAKYNKEGLCMTSAMGSSAIDGLYVATGRRDWQCIDQNHIWDRVIPALIMEESGCKVTTLKGATWSLSDKELVVANKYLHPTILKILNDKSR